MKLRFLVSTLALAVSTLAAHAQIGVYLNPVFTHVTNSVADTGTFAFLGSGQKAQTFGGVSLGGYYTFAKLGVADASVDVREEIQHGNNAALNSFLIGPHLVFRPTVWQLKPFVQVSVGAARTHSPLSTAAITRLTYEGLVGLDRPIARHVDFRVIEVAYGSATTTNSSIYQASTVPVPAARLLSFSTGLVFRFR
jgi:hypothetical protein